MCCLFGIIDQGHKMPYKVKNKLLKSMSLSAMDRGLDATGVSFFDRYGLNVQKDNKDASHFKFHLKKDTCTVIGHTRLATQGDNSKLYNLHPFSGECDGIQFALAHNGVIYNDKNLKSTYGLPSTKIETDSYVAVQLLEQSNSLDLSNISQMCEKLSGSYCFTILSEDSNVYLVRGNNPLCIYYVHKYETYVYASTKEILDESLLEFDLGKLTNVSISQYQILCFNRDNKMEKCNIEHSTNNSWKYYYDDTDDNYLPWHTDTDHLESIYTFAHYVGVSDKCINNLISNGYCLDEIETILSDMSEAWCK